MPTISQLPPAGSISAADEIPINQGGSTKAITVGALLAAVQPAITLGSPSLLGRTSLGSGGPEQVDIGTGINISSGTLFANGFDHSTFPLISSLPITSDLVISNQGSPMLMQASLLRGLFSAGQNVTIDQNGVISTAAANAATATSDSSNSIGALKVVSALTSQDLVAINQSGSDCAIAYGNFLSGVTIDEAQAAAPVGDLDAVWVAQGGNIMARQTFSAVWVWIANKFPSHKAPVVEITTDTILDTTVHNGRLLICSQPVTLTPLTSNMGSGFQCTVVNASAANITLGPEFVSSSGSFLLRPWQSAMLSCITDSAGTIAFAAMPSTVSVAALPGQVDGLSSAATTATSISVSWQAPSSGGIVSSYVVQFRPTGTTSWRSGSSTVSGTTYQLQALQPATSYDIIVTAENATGTGATSAILVALTALNAQTTVPVSVSGLAANSTSSSAVQLTWLAQTGTAIATSFTVHYRVTGSSTWTSSIAGLSGTGSTISGLLAATSYDFTVTGVNSAGAGPASSIVTAVTLAASQSVTSITWNLLPNGIYTHASGSVGINAQVSPAASPIQFGFSLSVSTPPSNWTAAILVNSNLWGAYVPTPATAGNWYAWAEGLDGSCQTVSPSSFVVQ